MLEFLKQPGIYECSFFIIGVFVYRFLANLLQVKVMLEFSEKISSRCLLLVMSISYELKNAIEMKREFLVDAGEDRNTVNKKCNEDKDRVIQWAKRIEDEVDNILNKRQK